MARRLPSLNMASWRSFQGGGAVQYKDRVLSSLLSFAVKTLGSQDVED